MITPIIAEDMSVKIQEFREICKTLRGVGTEGMNGIDVSRSRKLLTPQLVAAKPSPKR